jgi:hypothetical protein
VLLIADEEKLGAEQRILGARRRGWRLTVQAAV